MKNRFFIVIITGLVLGIFVKLFCIDLLHVSGISMESTLENGEAVIVNKLAYGIVKPFSDSFFIQWKEPRVDDIVIFLHDDKIVVKRCVSVGGMQLDFSHNTGYTLLVNNKEIMLTKEQFEKMKLFDTVPNGYILVIGDNYLDSVDSRNYGFVSVKNIIGKVIGK